MSRPARPDDTIHLWERACSR